MHAVSLGVSRPIVRRVSCLVASLALFCAPPVADAQSAAPFRLSAAPILTIGAEDKGPAYQLDRVYGAVRLPDGRIAVGNSSTGELRLYDARGSFLTSASRRGGGPGEFDETEAIFPRVHGATVVANDMSHARVNRYDFSGKVLPQLTLKSIPGAVQSVLDATAGSHLIARATASPRLQGAAGQRISTRYRFAVYDSTGVQRAALFELPSRERMVHAFGGSMRFPFIPFSPEPIVAASTDKIYLIRDGTPTIEVWSLAAKRIGTLTWNARPVEVRDIWTRWRQAELDGETRQTSKLFYEDFLSERLPLPKFVPVAEAMHVDPAGRIWIVRTRLPWEPARRCDVLDAAGRFLGTVALPPNFTMLQVGADFLLGRARDDDDVEQVQLYRLTPVGAR
ncbi:hypothetical protein [Gemmatimonas sp.]|uniref:hypothetical protein n=1 Tax=Gemmatimonas sp. TaxID=1962908 RepID=UPI00286D469B|nr:hypothetical protein [Gemmatimonas sp.]